MYGFISIHTYIHSLTVLRYLEIFILINIVFINSCVNTYSFLDNILFVVKYLTRKRNL